ncbi:MULTISPECIES: hypothetical protein [unclassified Sinorhizobium]|uniref:hypothetical protein n=1 Tax=unclassified Sinorhizobium TaxID=2613772 RepID=UPI003526493C
MEPGAHPPQGETALSRYDAERRPATSAIVLANRRGDPEGVIDMIEARAPDGFHDIDEVASHQGREAIVRGYATLARFAKTVVDPKPPSSEVRRNRNPRL